MSEFFMVSSIKPSGYTRFLRPLIITCSLAPPLNTISIVPSSFTVCEIGFKWASEYFSSKFNRVIKLSS